MKYRPGRHSPLYGSSAQLEHTIQRQSGGDGGVYGGIVVTEDIYPSADEEDDEDVIDVPFKPCPNIPVDAENYDRWCRP